MTSIDPGLNQTAPAQPKRGCGGACFTAFVVLLVIVGLGGVALFFGPPMIADYAVFRGGKIVQFMKERVDQFSKSTFTQNIQETFRQHTVRIASTNGNILEVATYESDEAFDRKTELLVGGVKVPFFDNTVTQKTRATYRYHIKLDGRWELRRETETTGTLVVIAPLIEPTLPVAFDSQATASQLKGYWIARYHQELSLEELRKQLTQKLEDRARSKENIDSVRDASRQSVAMFVKNWLVSEDQWRAEGFTSVKVIFPDEEQKDTEVLPATIKLNSAQLDPLN